MILNCDELQRKNTMILNFDEQRKNTMILNLDELQRKSMMILNLEKVVFLI